MNYQREFIARKFKEYLDRKSPPKNLGPKAVENEMSAIVRTVIRLSPKQNYEEWWPRFEDALDAIMKTRAWPIVVELVSAAHSVSKSSGQKNSKRVVFDDVAINAQRVQNGEAVGDIWIWGGGAVQMINRGLILENQLKPYRSALYFGAVDIYGEEYAKRIENGCVQRFADAGMIAEKPEEQSEGFDV